MRVLLLSCNTGEGHNSCAKAIKEVFDAKGDTCVTEDALRFISAGVSRLISRGHVFVYRHLPWLFNWGYRFTERHSELFGEKKLMYRFFGQGADELERFIRQGNYEAVICTHPFAALMLTETKRRHALSTKTAFVATDYTCSPGVKESALDTYFIPDGTLEDEFECDRIPREKMIASGIPIRPCFYRRTPKEVAKRSFGIPPSHRHLVVMCGSMGCGPIRRIAERLADGLPDGVELSVVCGTNEKLKRRLETTLGKCPRLHIFGYVTDMSAMLDSADLYLTKAGGISVTEAAAKELPMILINAVAGCEAYNSAFYSKCGCAVKSTGVEDVVQLCFASVADRGGAGRPAPAFDRQAASNAAECIYSTLKGEGACKDQQLLRLS